jgi:hypothetical protein
LRQRKQFMQNFRVIDENPAKKKLAGWRCNNCRRNGDLWLWENLVGLWILKEIKLNFVKPIIVLFLINYTLLTKPKKWKPQKQNIESI